MTKYYNDLVPTFSDTSDWCLPTVLRKYAAEQPDKVFLDAPEEDATWTYAEVLGAGENVARSFAAAGVKSGERMLVMARNSSQFVRTWFGTALGGMVEVPLNTAYEHDLLAHQAKTVDGRFAVIDDIYAERFIAVTDRISKLDRIWVIDTGNREEALARLTEHGLVATAWEELDQPTGGDLPIVRPMDLASIFFTSGTTGPSKGVAMPHAQMYFFGDETRAATRFTSADTYFAATPLFHGNAQFMAAFPALIAGGRFVVRSRFSARSWIDQIRTSGVTVTNLVGAMMDFVNKTEPRPDDAHNPLRCVYAAPLAHSIAPAFAKRFGIEAFPELFGLTETSAPIIAPYDEARPAGAAGRLASDFFEIQLVDPETDEEVPVGVVGELVVRPKQPWIVSMGYYNMPERTVEAWRNLWFHTGDALKRDDQGWYYFVDRFKDALRRRGENISSYEVEQGVLGSDLVLECAVIGVPAGIDGGEDEVMACIVSSVPHPDPVAIWAVCDVRLPKFAVPRYLRFVDHLPKTPSEKIRKADLRADGITQDTYDRENLKTVDEGGRNSTSMNATQATPR